MKTQIHGCKVEMITKIVYNIENVTSKWNVSESDKDVVNLYLE